jgi:hypothetical protein
MCWSPSPVVLFMIRAAPCVRARMSPTSLQPIDSAQASAKLVHLRQKLEYNPYHYSQHEASLEAPTLLAGAKMIHAKERRARGEVEASPIEHTSAVRTPNLSFTC